MLNRLFGGATKLTDDQVSKVTLNVVTNSPLFDELDASLEARAALVNVVAEEKKLNDAIAPLTQIQSADESASEVKELNRKISANIDTYRSGTMQQLIADNLLVNIRKMLQTEEKSMSPDSLNLATFKKDWNKAVETILAEQGLDGEMTSPASVKDLYVNALKAFLQEYQSETGVNKRKIALVREYYNEVIITYVMKNINKVKKPTRKVVMEKLTKLSPPDFIKYLTDELHIELKKTTEIAELLTIINSSTPAIKYSDMVTKLNEFTNNYSAIFGRSISSLKYYLPDIVPAEPTSPFSHYTSNPSEKVKFTEAYNTYQQKIKALNSLSSEQANVALEEGVVTKIFSEEFINQADNDIQSYLNEINKKIILYPTEWQFICSMAKTIADKTYVNALESEISELEQQLAPATTVITLVQAFNKFVQSTNSPLQQELAAIDLAKIIPEVLNSHYSGIEQSITALKGDLAAILAKKKQLEVYIISENIDADVASVLKNSFARALQSINDPQDVHWWGIPNWMHHGENRKETISVTLGEISTLSLQDLVTKIITLFETHSNMGKYGEGLHTNSFDTRLLQLLYNEGTPVGLFRAKLIDIQAVVKESVAKGHSAMVTIPLTDLKGEVVSWQQGPDSNPARMSKQLRQEIRDTAKQNLQDLVTLLSVYKKACEKNLTKMPEIVNVDNVACPLSEFVMEVPQPTP
jgi:hypothetical protein